MCCEEIDSRFCFEASVKMSPLSTKVLVCCLMLPILIALQSSCSAEAKKAKAACLRKRLFLLTPPQCTVPFSKGKVLDFKPILTPHFCSAVIQVIS